MDAGLPDAEEILYANEKKYPTSSLVLFFKGRILRCKVNYFKMWRTVSVVLDQLGVESSDGSRKFWWGDDKIYEQKLRIISNFQSLWLMFLPRANLLGIFLIRFEVTSKKKKSKEKVCSSKCCHDFLRILWLDGGGDASPLNPPLVESELVVWILGTNACYGSKIFKLGFADC